MTSWTSTTHILLGHFRVYKRSSWIKAYHVATVFSLLVYQAAISEEIYNTVITIDVEPARRNTDDIYIDKLINEEKQESNDTNSSLVINKGNLTVTDNADAGQVQISEETKPFLRMEIRQKNEGLE